MSKKIVVLSAAQRQNTFGAFSYGDLEGGRIQINPRWIANNLVECRLAKANGKGKDIMTQCHRIVKEPIERAFEEIAMRGLWKLIHTFDGLWVPRHMTWNSSRPLSSHSWGIAFDLNAATNSYGGGVSSENRALNEVFNRYGFAWGGDWKAAKDGMHWELADVEAWKRQSEPKSARLILAVDRNGSFSYHALFHAMWEGDHFAVDAAEVAQVLDVPEGRKLSVGPVPLRDALESLGAQIVKVGDYHADPYDPRYYVFVRSNSQVQPGKVPPEKVVAP